MILTKNNIFIITLFLVIISLILYYKIFKTTTINGNIKQLSSPILIFDFDGTICDSFDLAMNIYNELSKGLRIKKINNQDIEKLKGLSTTDILKELKISKWKLPLLAYKLRKKMKKKINEAKPHNGMIELLKYLYEQENVSLVLLTSNGYNIINTFFKKYNLNVFDVIISKVSTFGKSKMLKYLKSKIQNPLAQNIYYIADEVRDITACKKTDVKIISVTWGLNNFKILNKYKPDYICKNMNELEDTLKNIIEYKS
ncbi:MAG: HAD hydrolase-like protein [Bacteroidetes bacterium]|nr:HAD hydrolase-like protein [Bacteroidota bacterium]